MSNNYYVKCDNCKEVKECKEVPFIKIYQRSDYEPTSGNLKISKNICWECLNKVGVIKE